METAQEDTMAQTGAIAGRGQVEAIQAARCRVGRDVLDTTIRSRYKAVRSATSALTASFSADDQMVQSCPEASPMKWHEAHTTWFLETFVLLPFLKDYKPFQEEFHWLFNSYYNLLGQDIPDKGLRGAFSRPSLDEVLGYPGYKPLSGVLGEYNGKFVSSQMILRGGSCVTPASYIRATYRDFFSPTTRWQFAWVRFAS
jgi:hypothetical protein